MQGNKRISLAVMHLFFTFFFPNLYHVKFPSFVEI